MNNDAFHKGFGLYDEPTFDKGFAPGDAVNVNDQKWIIVAIGSMYAIGHPADEASATSYIPLRTMTRWVGQQPTPQPESELENFKDNKFGTTTVDPVESSRLRAQIIADLERRGIGVGKSTAETPTKDESTEASKADLEARVKAALEKKQQQ